MKKSSRMQPKKSKKVSVPYTVTDILPEGDCLVYEGTDRKVAAKCFKKRYGVYPVHMFFWKRRRWYMPLPEAPMA